MTLPKRNSNGFRSTALIAVVISVTITGASYLWAAATASKEILINKDNISALKLELGSAFPQWQSLSRSMAITQTKTQDNARSVENLETRQNFQSQEIQRNAENKLGKDDFFRFQEDMNERVTYLERKPYDDCPPTN